MAKVEMDMSEYEALKKVETLLEQSKAEQKRLYEELDKVQKEKIENLNEMAHQVLYKKTIIHKHQRMNTARQDIFTEFIRRWEEYWRYQERGRGHHMNASMQDHLSRPFFDILDQCSSYESTIETDESINYRGLDEVKQEIKAELILQIDENSKRALKFEQDNQDLAKYHTESTTKIIPGLRKDLDELGAKYNSVFETNEKQRDLLAEYNWLIRSAKALISNVNWFNKGETLKEISKQIKKVEDADKNFRTNSSS